jgi:hypothetical protein
MPQDDKALLLRLQKHNIDLVIVGGVCAVLHGVTLVTKDRGLCCRFTVETPRRIEASVQDLHPFHRLAANKLPLELTDELCSRLKNLHLQTDIGTLDCLGEIAGVGDYDRVLQPSIPAGIPCGELRMLGLEGLMDAKQAAGRPQDLPALRQLRATKDSPKLL